MRVDSTGSGSSLDKARRKAKSGDSAGASFADALADDATEAASTPSRAAPPQALSALLAFQEVDPDEGRHGNARDAWEYADEILKRLEGLRTAILLGTLSIPQLQNLARLTQTRQTFTADPHLLELLADIELRAKVEIAKYEMIGF